MASFQDEFQVYTGFWTNWSHGPILGATLTLSRRNANILISFTSIFLSVVGTRFWRILCIILHRWYSQPFEHSLDGLHHQRQLLLRNSHSPDAGLLSFLQLSLAWRASPRKRVLAATLLPMVLAALTFAGFIVAGGFSATISTSAGQEVLLDASNCGLPLYQNDERISYSDQSGRASDMINYAQQCYSADASGLLDCAAFVRSSLSSTIDTNATCPFQPEICKNQHGNLYMDSGFIDSDTHLGLNGPAADRIRLRIVTHCAPLVSSGYTSSFEFQGTNYTRYHYGTVSVVDEDGEWSTLNYTYHIPSLRSQYPINPLYTQLAGNFRLGYLRPHFLALMARLLTYCTAG
jgi:hypothetical protein